MNRSLPRRQGADPIAGIIAASSRRSFANRQSFLVVAPSRMQLNAGVRARIESIRVLDMARSSFERLR